MSSVLRRPVPAGPELLAVTLLGWLALLAIPLLLGRIGLGWDALNHHIYLGWTAEKARFDRDYLAASFQSYQFPYLYWPVYKLATMGVSGRIAGAVLATLHATVIPALWMISRTCLPGQRWEDVVFRGLAVVLAFSSVLVLSMFDSTSNDLLAAVPLVWSVALALRAMQQDGAIVPNGDNMILLSGLLGGVAVACKLSNGPLAVLTPLLWFFSASGWRLRARRIVLGGVASVAGATMAYGYWGWQLWRHVGNPVYPFADAWFEPLRLWAGWVP